jgi:hypothetical protein
MSQQLIGRSPDLQRLQDDGYDLEIRGALLLIKDVPYVDSAASLQRGTLILKLDLDGERTAKPSAHTAYWIGAHPCHHTGAKITAIENLSTPDDLGSGVKADFLFSAKADYRDYHHKATTYLGRIAGEATRLDPNVTACTFPAIAAESSESVFKYIDTASTRAGIAAVNERVMGKRIGIVGLGGTGSYILDMVAKTAVAEIHLFDGDVFSQHNAFRAPGAPTLEQLEARPLKVAYLAGLYSNMRHGIVVHDVFLEGENLSALDGLDFVFLCLDRGTAKRVIVERLLAREMPFVETGMGVLLDNGELAGIVRTTCCTSETTGKAAGHISYSADGDQNEYATNIQIAELNALNAAIAVISWKKHLGIYMDTFGQYYSGFSIPTGGIACEGIHEAT